MSKKPTVLMILDGYGLNEKKEANAIAEANTPVMDRLMAEYPFVRGNASGLAVGLPEGQMGNSEVGHINMGAGRIVYQELTRITKEIEDGTFFTNAAFMAAIDNCKRNHSDLHLYGLVSDGGVHSHNTHLYGLLRLAKKEGLTNVYVHAFLDGRDTAPTSGKGFIEELGEQMKIIGVGKIASVMGRYYAMDRDNRWDRVEKAYRAIAYGEGVQAENAVNAIQDSYDAEKYDEFVIPTVIMEKGKPVATVKENDSIIFFNFRPDRAREITKAFCNDDFDGFSREKRMNLTYVCFTEYDITIPNKLVAFHKVTINNTFGQFLAKNHKTQLRLAETEKYAHVTFFFNAGVEVPNEGEERILVNSPKVATYDLQPEMSAYEVADHLVKAIKSLKYDVIIVNFANPDMVGHTGVESAAIKAIETVDECVGKAVEALLSVDGQMFICADHGNAEQLVDYETGEPFTAHTINQVPFILVNYDKNYKLAEGGRLADIIPTLIEMMGMVKPDEMTGKSLLIKK
ncbi:MAG TPA: 2,3-bisphosphoglycerate-independent phosphoglycerate mutase [Lachnospiraceae bacterium]|jgi:2,3-bisphosphoglycerate-independent phosphoglycerate mutase|nr:2,3-bisphosphoglycerate-independent phosphoglycerate mutase [Lachnospiraceae bacterium]HBY71382.1 2,3-bisphosphoglycerate-independent phosphoglycerate mutase [Lachnospiraceae bacterium]HCR40364.1 2,3-bisphosphoglycerate-independent phosphoglycerate mutase [Lachnospiraceae bacterium]